MCWGGVSISRGSHTGANLHPCPQGEPAAWGQSTSPAVTRVQALSDAPYVLVGPITRAEGRGRVCLHLPWPRRRASGVAAGIELPSRSPGRRVGPKGRSEFPVCGCGSTTHLRRPGKARARAGIGADDEDRRCAEQSFFVIRWGFSLNQLPEPLVSESLLLHDSARCVILAGCRWWKNVLPFLECIFER